MLTFEIIIKYNLYEFKQPIKYYKLQMTYRKYLPEIFSVASIILIICIEPAYRTPLYEYSLSFIEEMQKSRNTSKDNFFKLISEMVSEEFIAGLMLLTYNFSPRRFFLKILALFFTLQTIMSFFKEFYHNPRPFFSKDNIDAISCSKGYGNPSGHCMFIIGFYGTLWTLIFVNNTDEKNTGNTEKPPCNTHSAIIKWILFILLIFCIISTFIARLYLGAHSLNQTIYGSLIGLWILFTFSFIIPKYINNHYESFSKGFKECLPGILITAGLLIVLQTLNLILYFTLRDRSEFMNDEWSIQINKKCPSLAHSTTPLEDSLKSEIYTSLYIFIYYAQIFGAHKFSDAFYYWFTDIGASRYFQRLLLIIVIMGPCFIPYLATTNSGIAVKILVGCLLPNILASFIGIPVLDWATIKLGLININVEGNKPFEENKPDLGIELAIENHKVSD